MKVIFGGFRKISDISHYTKWELHDGILFLETIFKIRSNITYYDDWVAVIDER